MKSFALTCLIVLSITGCASMQQQQYYAKQANSHSFDYYYPSYSGVHSFATVDEASDFINAAYLKLARVSNKRAVQGLSARLIGPEVSGKEPVTVAYFLVASDQGARIDLTKSKEPLEDSLRKAVSVASIFLVFSGDRGASISKFFLPDGWMYNSNSQYESFNFNDQTYKTDYPVGWGPDNAIKYLKKEID